MKPTCVIVGAGKGIGLSVALAFAREGYDIALASRSVDKLRVLQPAIEKAGALSRCYAVDAGDEASIRALFAGVRKDFGDPEVLVFNPAAHGLGKPMALTTDKLDADFRINVIGALLCAQEVAPAMKTKNRGTILFTGGGFAVEPAANYASLSLSKAALRNLTFSLAQELGTFGIHVATVTVYGFVQSGTHFDPARIADAYLKLHKQSPGNFQMEVVFK
jgi:NAD(P)-dependent dehydrogenase (short-subunit alcohol dehydrogenase family)